MKYNSKDKKTGIALKRDVFADQFAEPNDIRINYMITMYDDILIEGENTKELAKNVYNIIERLHIIYSHLNKIGAKRSNFNNPTGDK